MENTGKEIIQSRLLTNSKYDFSVLEKRVIYRLLECAQAELKGEHLRGNLYVEKDLFEDREVFFTLSDFAPQGVTIHNPEMKEALTSLESKVIGVNYPNGDWETFQFIRKAKYVAKLQRFSVVIDKDMWKFFLDFTRGYSQFLLQVAMSFKSQYAMRFYEMLHNNIEPIKYSVEWLRERFFLKDKYKYYKDFRKKVIENPINEINEKADIYITYTENKGKKGKAIESLTFKVTKKADWVNPWDEDKAIAKKVNNSSILIDRNVRGYLMTNCNFKDNEIIANAPLIKRIIDKYGAERTIDIIAEIKEKMLGRGIRNANGYLIKALQNLL